MKIIFTTIGLMLLTPVFALAQDGSLQKLIVGTVGFFNTVVIPFLLGMAFLFLVINVVRYFILESTTDDGRENAKALAVYSVMALVMIVIFWGIVNMIVESIGIGDYSPPDNDYVILEGTPTFAPDP